MGRLGPREQLRADFAAYASVTIDDGQGKAMTEEDFFEAFGVDRGHELYESAHPDGRGLISEKNFLTFAALSQVPRSALRETFDLLDADGDGAVTLEDLHSVIHHAGVLDSVSQSSISKITTSCVGNSASMSSAPMASPSSTSDSLAAPLLAAPPRTAPAIATTTTEGLNLGSGAAPTEPEVTPVSSETSFTEKYFGKDGKGLVAYDRFGDLVRDANNLALHIEWRSLKPDDQDTVSLLSFGRHLIKTSHDLPKQFAKNLLAVDPESRLSFTDFVIFEEVLDNLEELEQRLERVLKAHRKLDKVAFDEVVRSVSIRSEISPPRAAALSSQPSTSAAAAVASLAAPAAGMEAGSGSVVMDLLFTWINKNRDGVLTPMEVRSLLPLLRDQKAAEGAVPKALQLWQSIVLGGTSAAIAGTAVFPIDTVKSRLMNGQGTSIIGSFKDVIIKQGPLALYRGLPAQLVGIMPEKALKLTLYNALRTAMADPATQHVSLAQEALAGAGTAVVQVAITNPYELCKIRQQTTPGQPITETIRELGLRGMTKGISGCLLRDIPFNSIYFSSYAFLKEQLKPSDAPISPSSLMAAGLGAGLLAGALTTPPDVIKTRMQTDKTGRNSTLRGCITNMWAEGGARIFFKGLAPRVLLIPPLFAITMTCFETLQRSWFPQTVADPGLRQLLPRHTTTEVVKYKLKRLEDALAASAR